MNKSNIIHIYYNPKQKYIVDGGRIENVGKAFVLTSDQTKKMLKLWEDLKNSNIKGYFYPVYYGTKNLNNDIK